MSNFGSSHRLTQQFSAFDTNARVFKAVNNCSVLKAMHFQLYIVSDVCFDLYFSVELALTLLISCMWPSQICVLHIHVLTGQQEQFTCRLISSADRTLAGWPSPASGTLEASGPLTTCWDGKGKGPRIAP